MGSGRHRGKGRDEEWTEPKSRWSTEDEPDRARHRSWARCLLLTTGSARFRLHFPRCWRPDVKCAHSPDRLSQRSFSPADHRRDETLSWETNPLGSDTQQRQLACEPGTRSHDDSQYDAAVCQSGEEM